MARTSGPEPDQVQVGIFLDRLSAWMKSKILTPEYRAYKAKEISYLVHGGDEASLVDEVGPGFKFSEDVERQHQLVVVFIELYNAFQMLRDCEFYFRRYPFHSLPVSKENHFRYCCEMYFNSFYIFRERLKLFSNKFNDGEFSHKIDVKSLLSSYDHLYKEELKARNGVHHREFFDDFTTRRISLTGVLAAGKRKHSSAFKDEHLVAYRSATKKWAERSKRKAIQLLEIVESCAKALADHAPFLSSTDIRG